MEIVGNKSKRYEKKVKKELGKLAKKIDPKSIKPLPLEKQAEIDWDKVKTLEDLKYIISELGIRVDTRICSDGMLKYLLIKNNSNGNKTKIRKEG